MHHLDDIVPARLASSSKSWTPTKDAAINNEITLAEAPVTQDWCLVHAPKVKCRNKLRVKDMLRNVLGASFQQVTQQGSHCNALSD